MPAHTPGAPKKSVNLSVRESLLSEARDYKMNLSAALEEALEDKLRKERKRRWLEENREGLACHRERVRREGLWHKGMTPWY